ncbi:MAG: hypothetical protein PHI97_18220 [Desulfobulbus sp.]|nr:hypothetical protein [Desulfobulbus sp.]
MKHLLPPTLIIVCLLALWPGHRLLAEKNQDSPRALQGEGGRGADNGCLSCHPTVQPDSAHRFACTVCHAGDATAAEKDTAHQSLIAQPGHPHFMQQTCGKCHLEVVKSAQHSLHFTLKNEVNTVRRHFGASQDLETAEAIVVEEPPQTALALADDMLRRRCLRCHTYTTGDAYTAVTHGAGCASCHLPWKEGRMESHSFQAPKDRQCLSCHYGNHVGWDYYGRYEHDFNWEYRTPYTTKTANFYPSRPYGVEYHDLVPDIHQQRGLGCIDCHQRSGHEGQEEKLACRTCHGWKTGQKSPRDNLQVVKGQLVLNGSSDGRQYTVPLLRHPAHQKYGKQVDCQVCHAQWSFNDAPTHLLRTEEVDYDMWQWLAVQGSSEMERLLEHNAYDSDELPLTMRDGLSGESRSGVWLKGFGQRRWEQMLIDRDQDGIIKVFRPILDLRLSMVDEDGNALFDNIIGKASGKLPYTPHTTGHAGMFYLNRFQHVLSPSEVKSQ